MKIWPRWCELVRPLPRWRRIFMGFALVAAFWAVGRQYFGDFGRMRSVGIRPVVGIAILYIVSRIAFSRILHLFLRWLGHRVSAVESFVAMMLLPFAGMLNSHLAMGVVAGYLYTRRRVSPSEVGASFIAMNSLQVACVGLCGMSAVVFANRPVAGSPGRFSLVAVLFAAATLCGLGVTLFRFPLRASWSGPMALFVRNTNVALDRLGRGLNVFFPAFSWQILTLALRGLRLMVAYHAIGYPITFAGALLSSLLADLTIAVQVTPAGLGLREAVIGFGGTTVGVPADVSVSAALLDRIVVSGLVVIVTPLLLARCAPASATAVPPAAGSA